MLGKLYICIRIRNHNECKSHLHREHLGRMMMKPLLCLLPILAAVLNITASAYAYSDRAQAGNMLKSTQILALNLTKKTLIPVPGASSYARDTIYPTVRNKVAEDTTQTRIVGIREGGDVFRLILDLGEEQHNISINAFNLLGKKVLEVYQGPERAGKAKEYLLNVASLPNGIYICVVQGDNFRLAEKFIISR